MLKEYLAEAVSLIAEAVLGKPRQAFAGNCTGPLSPAEPGCNTCGADKKWWWAECYICGSGCAGYGCAWCPTQICSWC